MSMKASVCSPWSTIVAGSSPATILQKMQSCSLTAANPSHPRRSSAAGPGAGRAYEGKRLLTRTDLAGVLSPYERGQQPPHARPERDAKLARKLIAAQQRRGRTRSMPLKRVVEHPSSEVYVRRDRLLGFR